MATWAGPPRAYTTGRARPVQYVVIHSTEGSEGVNSAEAGVAYDKVRTDGTSTHLFVDADTALMEVRYSDTAHAARTHGNACGIQVELCGRAGQTAAQWHDAASLPMLRIAAREVAAICREFSLPVRRLSVAEVRAAYYAAPGSRPKGICGHVDVTAAYPEDQGSHTDPGPNFPWSEFLAMVSAELKPPTGDNMQRIARDPVTGQNWIGDGVWRNALTGQQATDWIKAGVPYDGDKKDLTHYGRDVDAPAAVSVDLDAEDIAALAAQVDVPSADEIAEAVADEDHRRSEA